MALPGIPLTTDTVTLSSGDVVDVRCLSRTKAGRIAAGEFKGQMEDAEVFLITHGCQVTAAEAKTWLDTTPPDEAGKVIDRILEMSSLKAIKEDAEEGAPDPQAGSSGRSKRAS